MTYTHSHLIYELHLKGILVKTQAEWWCLVRGACVGLWVSDHCMRTVYSSSEAGRDKRSFQSIMEIQQKGDSGAS